jgi:chromosome segregation protein
VVKFTQLRLAGFKSFVDATELRIDPGLTGIIGPNGCGKSNLLEALRWVMGATSAKSLRGGGMEDVIFSGTDNRASRDRAEVTLTIDNSDRRAPARFNDAEILEVVRRITRGKGSDYEVNGEEVRAKDVQLLFADAGTGANSPALVRQGQISELISAKPENRRRVLEEAAGVAGLRARRRESQLRLTAAEANLARLQEIVDDLATRHASLQRQARQAGRYRELSQTIRQYESLLWLRRWSEARDAVALAEAALEAARAEADTALRAAAEATSKAETAAARVQPLREGEAEAAAALRLAERTRDQLDRDIEAANEAITRLDARLGELQAAEAREAELHEEARASLDRLKGVMNGLREQARADAPAQARAEAALSDADATRQKAEADLDAAGAACADFRARLQGARRDAEQARQRADKLERETDTARTALERAGAQDGPDLAALEAGVGGRASALEAARSALAAAEAALTDLRDTAGEAKDAARDARGDVIALEREQASLERLLAPGETGDRALDDVSAAAGYEQALAAALGEDLEAGLSPEAARRWTSAGVNAAALPAGAKPLSDFVRAPAALAVRLAAIGVVDEADLDRLTADLKPGQRLVTLSGALRRWDGYAADAGAPGAAAVRLETLNQLAALGPTLEAARAAADALEATATDARDALNEAERAAARTRETAIEAERALRSSEQSLSAARAESARAEARRAGLVDALKAAEDRLAAARKDAAAAAAAVTAAEAEDDGMTALDSARTRAERARGAAADARAALETIKRDAQGRRHRLASLERETADWERREADAGARRAALTAQLTQTTSELETARARPGALEAQRPALLDALTHAEQAARTARDAVAEAESAQREADSHLRQAEGAAATAREARAGAEARLTGARERLEETAARLTDATGETPETLAPGAADSEFSALSSQELERRLDEARLTRERLGAVNLRADTEAQELEAERARLAGEHDELVEAVARLRKAVDTLSREGRARLLDAFEVVDRHFQTLFSALFGGGRAELALTENDDPLEAGLEIYACPPGKKMETMSLMSGGEQALTATALIFAVFLANPAPVCVLDEVDAPLDDANVDRFCSMLEEMRSMTDTRFLVITHNPVTMSRMDRLFGVTMGERGVSQLVSVNLRAAEAMLAAE